GRSEEATHLLKKALEINKSNSTASCLLAGILNDLNSSDALKYYKMSTALNPRCYLAYRGLGNFYLKMKDYTKAEENYTEAIGVNPQRFSPIYKNRGLVRLELNKTKQAKEDFKKYLEQMPEARDKANILQAIAEL
ncbi:MAG TPA: tetratricopeptide repeat protein, partial [Candidatus Bathyarchaeia archaeon]|nr:tetratricopeptide repeat protein [Candidatus Bathyarchaeia archaeon]